MTTRSFENMVAIRDKDSSVTSGDGPFTQRIELGRKSASGLVLFDNFLSKEDADKVMILFDSRQTFPWVAFPSVAGTSHPQNAYLYPRQKASKAKLMGTDPNHLESIAKLEELCRSLEGELDVKVSDVYCSRYVPNHYSKSWHNDSNAKHAIMLVLGAAQAIQFQNLKTNAVDEVMPQAGDLLFIPYGVSVATKHRICPAAKDNTVNRLTFTFFVDLPSYAPREYRITTKSKLKSLFAS